MSDPFRPTPKLTPPPKYPGVAREQTNPKIRLERKSTNLKLVGVVVLGVSTSFGVFFALEARAERMLELRVAPIEKEQGHQKDDLHEIGKDVRELYRVMPKWGPSERLERPFPEHADGGQ